MVYYVVNYTGNILRFTTKDDLIAELLEWTDMERVTYVDSIREAKEWLEQYGE